MKQSVTENARIYGSIGIWKRTQRGNGGMVRLKLHQKQKDTLWKDGLGVWDEREIVKERCMEIYKREKEVNRYIYHSKKETNI